MNRNNKILVGVLALIVAMTIGYALFSDKITITGTAKAKGDFKLEYTCEKIEEGSATGSCTIEGNKIITTSTLSKPTDVVGYNIMITNNGSIPAVLKAVGSSNNVSRDDPNIAGDSAYIDKTTMLAAFFEGCKLQADGETCEGKYGDGAGDSALASLNITLQPGEKMNVSVAHMWADSSDFGTEQPKIPEEGATMKYDVELGFEQATN